MEAKPRGTDAPHELNVLEVAWAMFAWDPQEALGAGVTVTGSDGIWVVHDVSDDGLTMLVAPYG